jgi:hypothetical protein
VPEPPDPPLGLPLPPEAFEPAEPPELPASLSVAAEKSPPEQAAAINSGTATSPALKTRCFAEKSAK